MHKLKDNLQNYFNNGQTKEAQKYLFSNLMDKNKSSGYLSEVAYYLGRIFFYNSDYINAEFYFKESLNYCISQVYAKLYLGIISEIKGNLEKALRIYASCIITNPELEHLKERISNIALRFELSDNSIKALIKNTEEKLKSENKYPLVSILVLCYNKLEYTEKCLTTIFNKTHYDNYEVIVVDNGSVDNTSAYLEAWGNKIKFIHSKENLGFVGGNNLAAQHATGEYILFLNNDTEVTENWLIHLYNTFIIHPQAGAVGSMLVYPDGKLQEAGGIIFNDATGWNYGKGGSVNDSRFSFLREVDYCSAASLMVKKELFIQHGGFDERFAPAYFEDTDLCFGIRKLGKEILYCPLSKVVHHEGTTAGTDLSKGFKKYQKINTSKFIAKWSNELKKQSKPDPNLAYHFSNRKKGKRILIIDDIPPFPDRAAGALRHYHTLKQLLELGNQVTYVHLMGKDYNDKSSTKYFNEFKMKGVEFFWFNYELWWSYRESKEVKNTIKELIELLDLPKRKYDLIYIAFWYIANYFIDDIRKQVPNVPILVDSMDLHYLRETRQAEISDNKNLLAEAKRTKEKELNVYQKADCITTVTENDRQVLKKELPDKSVLILTDVHDPKETKIPFEERKDLLFIGNFNHNPNEDAVLYFVKEIFPTIQKAIPDIVFKIVGNNPTEKIKKLESKNIFVSGWVPEVEPYLSSCRVSVVPLRYGAGNKGKVGETLSHGLPMVSTSIGAEGMGIINEEHSFVSDDPQKFSEYCIELYNNKSIWENFSVKGKDLIASQYSSELMRKRLKYIMSFNTREKFKSYKALNFSSPPNLSIIIVTYNQKKYTLECIESIYKTATINFEIILVDNNSSDNTVDSVLKKWDDILVIQNQKNLGFPKAVNQGLKAAIGENILLLNNDTVVTKNSIQRLIEILNSDINIGIIGPISNSVSGVQLDKKAKYSSISEMHNYADKIADQNKGKIEVFPRVAFLCTLIKKAVIDKIGGLDERFSPGNFEDDDFCLRAQLAGFKTAIAKDVFIHHYGSVSFKQKGEKEYSNRLKINEEKFINKWGSNPDGIWLKNEKIKNRSINYPINKDEFIQSIERAFNNIDDEEMNLALKNVKMALENFDNSNRKGYQQITKEELLNIAGNLALSKNELELAKDYFEKELEIYPTSSKACYGLGEVFNKAEMFEEAKTMLEWAVVNDTNNINAQVRLKEINIKLNLPENHNSIIEEQVIVEGK